MKLGLIIPPVFLAIGCSSEPVQKVKDIWTIQMRSSVTTHLVWCKRYEECLDTAALFCSPNPEEQSPAPGIWHLVPEPGMVFPAMIEEPGGWRILIACEPASRVR